MKLRYYFLFLFSTVCLQTKIIAQQSGKIIYKVRPNSSFRFEISGKDILNALPRKVKDSITKLPEKQKKEILDGFKKQTSMQHMDVFERKVLAIASDFEFILKFNQTESIYSIDTPMRDENTNRGMFVLAKLEGGGDFIFYVKRNDSIYLETNPNEKPEVWTKHKMRKWTITNETGTMGKYKVIKAVSGENTAWFTPNIPVPFGPYAAGGLPGLILKYIAGPRELYAYKIMLYKKNIKIPRPKGKIIDEKEWNRRNDIKKAKAKSGYLIKK